ncbi:MAG: GxxExxY protein [Bacteroidetes bacterium]|nr:GxxExxY protein [Bacteroidota bacterium]
MKTFQPLDGPTEHIASQIVDAGMEVHRTLGAGLLESIYERSLAYELTERGFHVEQQVIVPTSYKEMEFSYGFRLDLLVEERIIVEIKSVDALLTVHRSQLLTYLKLMNLRLGFLMNFNVPILKNGIKRVIL